MSMSILDDETIFSEEKFNKDELELTFTVPLAVVFSKNLPNLSDKETEERKFFDAELLKLRSSIYYDLGVMIPFCYLGGDAPLPDNQYYIALYEVPVAQGILFPDKLYVNDTAENIKVFGLTGENITSPKELTPGAWIPSKAKEIAEAAGLKVWDYKALVLFHLSKIMRKYAHEFVGVQETQGYLDFISKGMPRLVEELVPKTLSLPQLKDVLQRLVQEGISVRDLKNIFEALVDWGRIEKDPVMLTEHTRASLRRYISFRYTNGNDTLFVYLLDLEIEDVIRGAIRRTSTGSFLSLDPTIAHDILDEIRREINDLPQTAQQPVIVTDAELRRFLRKMVELEFPSLVILSYQELSPELNIQPIGRISMRKSEDENDPFQLIEDAAAKIKKNNPV